MSRQPTLAIVTDEENLAVMLRYNFESEGYRVRIYGSTAEALELIEKPADVALLDRTNSPFDGVELYRRLRQHVDMPVIFLTAWAHAIPDELRRKELPPAEDYVQIPMSIKDLLERVRTVVERPRKAR